MYRVISCDAIAEIKDGKPIRLVRNPDPDPDPEHDEHEGGEPELGKPSRPQGGKKQDQGKRQPGETEPGDEENGGDGMTDNDPSHLNDTGDSNQTDLLDEAPYNNPDYWGENDVRYSDFQPGANSAPHMGQDGYGDYVNDVTEEYVVTPGIVSGLWYDNVGNTYTYNSSDQNFSDLNGTIYTFETRNGVVYIQPDDNSNYNGLGPEDFLEPDWNDPGDDDSWVDNYSDLPTDEDGDTDFSSTFGLDDGE